MVTTIGAMWGLWRFGNPAVLFFVVNDEGTAHLQYAEPPVAPKHMDRIGIIHYLREDN